MLKWLIVISMLSVTGCATFSAPVTLSKHPLCKPISWHELDTPSTQREIFAHNLKVEDPSICQ